MQTFRLLDNSKSCCLRGRLEEVPVCIEPI
jgi:hypothetical protein